MADDLAPISSEETWSAEYRSWALAQIRNTTPAKVMREIYKDAISAQDKVILSMANSKLTVFLAEDQNFVTGKMQMKIRYCALVTDKK